MQQVPIKYQRHVFVCVNERPTGECCGKREESWQIAQKLRDHINANGLIGKYNVSKSRCLGHCAEGPTVAVYPDGKIFKKVSADDAEKIIEEFLSE